MKGVVIAGLIIALIYLSACQKTEPVSMTDTVAHGQPAFRIGTAHGVYIYQKEAGGFSSLMDASDKDWIGFKPDSLSAYPNSAAGSYRGLPNLVFGGEDDGAGHPGFDRCMSEKVGENMIRTTATSGNWQWSWTFHEKYALLDIEKIDTARQYWFLYEGTVGGRYQPQFHYWGTDKGGPFNEKPDHYLGNEITDRWQWIYLGDEKSPYVLFLAQAEPDQHPDTFSFLGNAADGIISPDGMAVVGFGRDKGAVPLLNRPEKFLVGLYEGQVRNTDDHRKIKEYLEALIRQATNNP